MRISTDKAGILQHRALVACANNYRRPLPNVIMASFKPTVGIAPAASRSMEGAMPVTVAPLEPGKVLAEHFDLLLEEGTGIKGEGVRNALHDYLVKGDKVPECYAKYGVAKPHFYSRLKIIQKAHDYACRISKFYIHQTVTTVVAIGKDNKG